MLRKIWRYCEYLKCHMQIRGLILCENYRKLKFYEAYLHKLYDLL